MTERLTSSAMQIASVYVYVSLYMCVLGVYSKRVPIVSVTPTTLAYTTIMCGLRGVCAVSWYTTTFTLCRAYIPLLLILQQHQKQPQQQHIAA